MDISGIIPRESTIRRKAVHILHLAHNLIQALDTVYTLWTTCNSMSQGSVESLNFLYFLGVICLTEIVFHLANAKCIYIISFFIKFVNY